MKSFIKKITLLFTERDIRNKIVAVLGIIVLYRFFAAIPVPGVNAAVLAQLISSNQLFSFLDLFSGGGISTLSLVMMGAGPYITGSIIMQLLTVLNKDLKSMYHEEGEAGRKRFNQISRFVTLPIAALQGYGLLVLLQRQGVLVTGDVMLFISQIVLIVAGAYITLWLGERISEYGIGSGVSIIIFAGIIATFPSIIRQASVAATTELTLIYVVLGLITVLIIAGIVFISESERKVPIAYTRQIRDGSAYGNVSSHIPFRLNQAGVMPIIFAISILTFPQLIGSFLTTSSSEAAKEIGVAITAFMTNQWWYGSIYFVLVIVFTYFYTAITVEPHTMAENLHKNGAFVPGVRPGSHTEQYIGTLVSRITLVGALFLGIIAIIPNIVQGVTGLAVGIGGTSILIVVSVVIDLAKKLDALVSTRLYE
jgi:preprotein translocase subunit SecY